MNECFDDDYIWEKNFKKLNSQYLNHIPGLHMIARASLNKADFPLTEHFHRNRFEFVVIISGNQQYTVQNVTYSLFGGDVFTTFPDEPHGNNQEHQAVCEFIWFQIDMSEPAGFLGLTAPLSQTLYTQTSRYEKRLNKVNSNEILLLIQAFENFSSRDPEKQLLAHTLFLSFFTKLIASEHRQQNISSDIQSALDYIEENITSCIELSILADVSGLSVSRLKTKFKEQMGITPREYINFSKVEHAKNLLKQKDYSITDVAFLLNFSSSNYFSSVFKQFTGITPSEYRLSVAVTPLHHLPDCP